jgi:hypothetical protein
MAVAVLAQPAPDLPQLIRTLTSCHNRPDACARVVFRKEES